MKINCQDNCKNCRHKNICNLIKPTNQQHTLLLKEIQYWLKQYRQTTTNLHEYHRIQRDIHENKYTTPINVYGTIKNAPKTNAYGVFIKKPEHVHYGWNHQKLTQQKQDLFDKIRRLNKKELNMRKILEKNEVKT